MFITSTTLQGRQDEMKEKRDFIIECIQDSITANGFNITLKEAMCQFSNIVTASNYAALDMSIQDTVDMACEDAWRIKTSVSSRDTHEMFLESALKNLPSSMI